MTNSMHLGPDETQTYHYSIAQCMNALWESKLRHWNHDEPLMVVVDVDAPGTLHTGGLAYERFDAFYGVSGWPGYVPGGRVSPLMTLSEMATYLQEQGCTCYNCNECFQRQRRIERLGQ